eukprot:1556290-Alexandrium_andersonii.AAC.1
MSYPALLLGGCSPGSPNGANRPLRGRNLPNPDPTRTQIRAWEAPRDLLNGRASMFDEDTERQR